MYRTWALKEKEFSTYLKQLNAIMVDSPFQGTKANKNHDDHNGLEIRSGEIYYRRQHGPRNSDCVRLSKRSMESLLFALFWGNFQLQDIGDLFIERNAERNSEVGKALEKYTQPAPSGDPEKTES